MTPVLVFLQWLPGLHSHSDHNPVKQKKYIHWMLTAMFVTALMSFMTLGIIVPLWFKASVQETVTLKLLGKSIINSATSPDHPYIYV